MPKVKIKGLDKLKRTLDRLPKLVVKRVVREATKAAAEVIADEVRGIAPVDTGILRDAIKVVYARSRVPGSTVFQVVVSPADLGGETYPAHVEFGTSKMPAKPFMRPGLDKGGPLAAAVYLATMRAGIAREAATT